MQVNAYFINLSRIFKRFAFILRRILCGNITGLQSVERFLSAKRHKESAEPGSTAIGSDHQLATGRPGYDPVDLLKLYIYGYLNRVRSSCRLEFETRRNIEVIWLLRSLTPDFKTIADFRGDNSLAFRQEFRELVVLRRELDHRH